MGTATATLMRFEKKKKITVHYNFYCTLICCLLYCKIMLTFQAAFCWAPLFVLPTDHWNARPLHLINGHPTWFLTSMQRLLFSAES